MSNFIRNETAGGEPSGSSTRLNLIKDETGEDPPVFGLPPSEWMMREGF
jgi:hypothetical protein